MITGNVLVTDGNQRAALAVTRSLGIKGIKVVTADIDEATISSASKYSTCSEVYPHQAEVGAFLEAVKRIIARHEIRVIIPITEVTLFILLRHRSEFPNVVIPFDTYENISLLSDKAKLIDICNKLSIPCPGSVYMENGRHALSSNSDFNYPIVLKPYKSRILSEGQWVSTSVKYAANDDELQQFCTNDPVFSEYPFILQEYIQGHGQGVFLLFDNGRPVASFCHKRLREKPPSGGVSVLSESVPMPVDLEQMSIKLLKEVGWHGVAMVEFKVSEDGRPYIMEVNTRFWGSLQLAVDAGVDFPYLLYKIALGQDVIPVAGYKENIRLRWLLGDLDRLYLVLRSSERSTSSKLREIAHFLAIFGKGLHYEVNRISDFRPFIREVRQYVSSIFHKE